MMSLKRPAPTGQDTSQPAFKKRRTSSNFGFTALGNLFQSFTVNSASNTPVDPVSAGSLQPPPARPTSFAGPSTGLARSVSTSSVRSNATTCPRISGLQSQRDLFSHSRKQALQYKEQTRLATASAQAPALEDEHRELMAKGYFKENLDTYKGLNSYAQLVASAHRRVNSGFAAPNSNPVLREVAQLHKGQKKSEGFQRVLANVTSSLKSPAPPISTPTLSAHAKLQRKQAALDKELEKRSLRRRKFRSTLAPEHQKAATQFMNDNGLVVSMTGAQVAAKDIRLLKPGKWLNDEVINFYAILINTRSKAAEEARKQNEKENPGVLQEKGMGKKKKVKAGEEILKVHAFTSFFYNKLQSAGYEGVRRWTKKVDVFACDAVLMPINLGNAHWVCACINVRQKRFEFYDSMGHSNATILKGLRDYLQKEHQDKKKKPLDLSDWVDYEHPDIPQQMNGFDCGVFTSQTLECLSRKDASLDFAQENMPYLRQKMVYEIGTKQFLHEDWA